MDDLVCQEFYCNECDGYFRPTLNMALKNWTVDVMCPNCGHLHRRTINDGRLYDRGADPKETVRSPKSTYRKEPITSVMIAAAEARKKNAWGGYDYQDIRRGAVCDYRDPATEQLLRESWQDRHLDRV